jgi:CRISPR-associated protein Csm4
VRFLAKLRFRAPLHIGSSTLGEEDTYDYAPSDTLFSALCHAYLGAFGVDDLVELLGRFDSRNLEPPFLVSSAFPYCGDTLFLPLPRLAPKERAGETERGDRKLLKDAAWVSLEDFTRLLDGGAPAGIEANRDRLPRKELLPRVALDRESSNSSIYYVRRAAFPENGGLWALLDVRDETLESRLRQSLHLLGDMGLGGERTMGCGFFEPEFAEPPQALTRLLDGEAPYIALSRVSPGPEEAAAKVERYTLVESRGWMQSPTGLQRKRRSAWFFAEGSTFAERVRGRLLDVTPQDGPGHPVYRYGFGMYLGAS